MATIRALHPRRPAPTAAARRSFASKRDTQKTVVSSLSPTPPAPETTATTSSAQRQPVSKLVNQPGGVPPPFDVSRGGSDSKEVVLATVAQNLRWYAFSDLRADKEVVIAAAAQHGDVLMHAAEDLRADKWLVLAVVAQHGVALRRAAQDLRADKEVVLAAVAQNGYALSYASADLQADEEQIFNYREYRMRPHAWRPSQCRWPTQWICRFPWFPHNCTPHRWALHAQTELIRN